MRNHTPRRLTALERRKAEHRNRSRAVVLFNDDPLADDWQGRSILRLTCNFKRRLEAVLDGQA